ncbi:Mannuronan C5-epimerase AlgE5, partial [Frankliniella fusca]
YGIKFPLSLQNEATHTEFLNRARNYILGLKIRDLKTNAFVPVLETDSGSMQYLSTKKLSQGLFHLGGERHEVLRGVGGDVLRKGGALHDE